MIYTDLTRAAMIIAYAAYNGQVDKAGVPYIFHVAAVADKMLYEKTTCIALLHDVLENTNTTSDDLRAAGIPDDIISSVEIITRKSGETYMDYIHRVANDYNACAVKIADLKHNMDESRLPLKTKKSYNLRNRYEKALSYLEQSHYEQINNACMKMHGLLKPLKNNKGGED